MTRKLLPGLIVPLVLAYGGTASALRSMTWQANSSYGSAANTEVGDFNGDGLADIASLVPGSAYMKLSTGAGFNGATWSAGNNLSSGGYTCAGDFNGDGRTDLATAISATVYVKLNTGAGFQEQAWPVANTYGSAGYTFCGDFNGDGKSDIASANAGSVHMKLSTGNSFISQTWSASNQYGSATYTFVGDFNGDGKADIASAYNATMYMKLSTGSGFQSVAWSGATNQYGGTGYSAAADFNGDGKTDIASAYAGTLFVKFSTGSGFTSESFSVANTYGGPGYFFAGDFNGDHKADIASPYAGAHHMKLSDPPIPQSMSTGDLDVPYRAFSGDWNGDGRGDLYIAQRPQNVAVDGVVPPTGPLLIPDMVLQNDGRGSFGVVAPLSAQQLAQLASWPASAVELTLRDADVDGRADLETTGVPAAIPGAFNHVIFAEGAGTAPTRLTPMNDKFQRYHGDLLQWMVNPNYFQQMTFQRVTGVEPARKTWVGSVRNASNLSLVSRIANWCSAAFPNNVCGVSSQPPANCIMNVDVLGPNGEVLGQDTVNVCGDPFHIYVYVPGQVTLAADTSATDADARATAEILFSFNFCNALDPIAGGQLADILGRVYGPVLRPPFSNRTNNSFSHPSVPGDELFDPTEATFHHYDARTQICDFGNANCRLDVINNEVFRYFSYPALRLQPDFTAVDGVERVTAYISLPDQTENSNAYFVPVGPITQRFLVGPGFAQGAIQNITEPSHLSFPGFITRKVRANANGIEVFTHGIGQNRALCTPKSDVSVVNVLIAYGNDRFGPPVFRQLDREMRKYYQRFFFIEFPSPPPAPNVSLTLPTGARVRPGTVAPP